MPGGLGWLILRRLALGVPLILTIVALTFMLTKLAPGDPALLLAGDAPTPEFLAQVRAEYDLDKPLLQQFTTYLGRAAQGNLGTSIYFGTPVTQLILQHFPVTLLLTCVSMFFASVLGIVFGAIAADRRDTPVDAVVSGASLLGFSIPIFWLGQLLVLLFAVHLDWLPAGGMSSARVTYYGFDHVLDVARHLVLPVTTLMLFEMAMITRFTRAAMIEALGKDYVTVAYAKGADHGRVLWRHALPNALVTSVTIIGLEFGVLLAGAVVTEIIFGLPGLGRLFFDSIFRRDFQLMTGCFIFASAAVVVVNIITDIVVATLDPRVNR
ncbi:MAG: ABC transporter permease [Rhizobiales bacterium]|nr:ABC transporter permease [Hyphomicrobiales bacterium]